MKQIIRTNFTRNQVDSFLKRKFEYGIWEFEFSLVYIYSLYYEKKEEKVFDFIDNRIRRLETIKKKTIEIMDDFSTDMNLYKLQNRYEDESKRTKWTPQAKSSFIIKKFKLSPFYSVIDSLINGYQEHKSYLKEGEISKIIDFRVNLKPINLAVLIWSHAMRRGKNVDWINMGNLLNWMIKKLKEMSMIKFYGFDNGYAPSSETLRLTWNKYKKTKYYSLSESIFLTFFKKGKDEGSKRFPKPLDDLDDYLKWEDKDLDHNNKLSDIHVLSWFLFDVNPWKDLAQ